MLESGLKQGKFKVNGHTVEKYIVENKTDLNKFGKKFEFYNKDNFTQSLSEGLVILFGEKNMTGYNSYCFECKDTTSTHPSSHIRV
jgi:hypothetical protein